MTLPRTAVTAAPTHPERSLCHHHSSSNSHESSCACAVPVSVTAATKDVVKGSESVDMRSQTCVEFLHIMKEFSESSCDASETVQRVDSLVSQDEQLLRLFPLSRSQEKDQRLARVLEDETQDERIAARDGDKEMDTQDELQRWMDLDLGDLDHHMDVFDFQHLQPPVVHDLALSKDATRNACGVSPTAKQVLKRRTNGVGPQKPTEAGATEGSRAKKAAIASQRPVVDAVADQNSPRNTRLEAPAVLDQDDVGLDFVLGSASNPPRKRAKVVRPANTRALRVSVSLGLEHLGDSDYATKADDDEDGNVWGMETNGYEHDLLASIDHAVLCDRENRFLHWDVEAAHQQEQQRLQTHATAELRGNGRADRDAENPKVSSTHRLRHQCPNDKVMASSPLSSKSPSNVEMVEDWNRLDFGTFQNRTVSHILSSCLQKRKLHHPYKNQVQLVNFSVPSMGEAAAGQVAQVHPPQLGGSLATSLAFGGQQTSRNGVNGTSLSGFVPLLAAGQENGGTLKSVAKGEKKTLKKRDERKRLMTLKMQETFADLEGTFTEQELDVKGIVGPGASLSKMALSKLENLPLPDLTNLPHDLRELKRKIEATEHKVEGTKHRHRKGGPCPRCQVQNQLRAAKRAYHKRAVAHKKLPQVVVNTVNDEAQEAANAQAAVATLDLGGTVTAARTAAISMGARKGSTVAMPQGPRPAASIATSPLSSLCSASSMANSATVKSTSGSASSSSSSSSSSCGSHSPRPSLSRFRGPCGSTSLAARPFPSPSSASLSTDASTTSSSPDSHLQHVTVTSG